nr:13338_t:CDS:2 [Entrophospora candida]
MSSSPASHSNSGGDDEPKSSKTFKLHSEILKKNSPYFTSAFSSEWVKKDENNDGLIIFEKPNISAEDFELILLVPADEDFIKEIETYLINNHRRWSKKGFGIHYLSMTVRLKICKELQTFAINLFAQNPQILFDSNKHLYLEDDVLFVGLLKHEDFLMDEIEIWEFMIDWAKSNNDLSKKDIKDWSTEDFQRVSKSMENILPLIRFNNILANEFYEKVQPYRSIFTNHAFYENILWNYILPQKKINSSLTDKSFWRPANNSFIFSMDTDPNKWDSARLSRINPDFSEKAFLISNYSGPQFGNGDLKLGDHFNFKTSSCKKSYYLESIRNTDDNFFSIEEYELFQLVKGV